MNELSFHLHEIFIGGSEVCTSGSGGSLSPLSAGGQVLTIEKKKFLRLAQEDE